MLLARLKYDGVHLSYPNILERLNYDRQNAMNSMLRLEFKGQNLRNIGDLSMNNRPSSHIDLTVYKFCSIVA